MRRPEPSRSARPGRVRRRSLSRPQPRDVAWAPVPRHGRSPGPARRQRTKRRLSAKLGGSRSPRGLPLQCRRPLPLSRPRAAPARPAAGLSRPFYHRRPRPTAACRTPAVLQTGVRPPLRRRKNWPSTLCRPCCRAVRARPARIICSSRRATRRLQPAPWNRPRKPLCGAETSRP